MFNGFWWNDAGPNRQWVHDKNSLLYIDFKVEHHQSLPLSDIYGEILQMCFQSYKVKKAPQIEIWMTRERIERVLIADQDTIDPEEKAAEDVGDGETKNAYVNSRNNATAPLSTE